MIDLLKAIFLGFIEGVTEFIPVSSTGHLVVFADLLDFHSSGHVFEVFIQLGAILAVMLLYWEKIFSTLCCITHDKTAQKFALNVIVASIPALIVGAVLHHWIKALYTSPVIGTTLVVGGIVLLLLEKKFAAEKIKNIDDISLRAAFLIGLFQMLALIPGVSRAGATIIGALALGLDRRTAAEFSFFLAIPVIAAAALFDIVSNWNDIAQHREFDLFIAGFVAAFITALAVLKLALRLITSRGFAPFAWYRIAAGAVILLLVVI